MANPTDHLATVRAALVNYRSPGDSLDDPDTVAAIAALADECERLRATASALDLKVADMSDTIANERTRRALEREEFRRALEMAEGDARRHLTSFAREAEINADQRARIATLEDELAQARAHRCGGIVLSAEDADRIAALLEDPPAPTPAMVALFAKAKE